MKDVQTVAAYICNRYEKEHGERIDEMKLHKLLYFAQRECLVQRNEPLFDGEFQGWRFGPVVPEIRVAYRDDTFSKEVTDLGEDNEIMDAVFEKFADKDSWSLSRLTHSELSWKISRKGIDSAAVSKNVIPLDDIRLDAERVRRHRESWDPFDLLGES